jgi:hypothetical protein
MIQVLLLSAISPTWAAPTLPESTAEEPPRLRCHVVVDAHSVQVDGLTVAELETVVDAAGVERLVVPEEQKRGMLISTLFDALRDRVEGSHLEDRAWGSLAVLTQHDELDPTGELLLSIDAQVPFSVVRDVLYTAGQAEFDSFQFVVHNPWEGAERFIESALPRIRTAPREPVEDCEPPMNLSILLSERGIDLRGADRVLRPERFGEAGALLPTVPCAREGGCHGVEDYDWHELSRVLGLIKDEYPDDLDVIIVPSRDTEYEVMVRALDVARWAPHLPIEADVPSWEDWKRERWLLFPWPVLAGGVE